MRAVAAVVASLLILAAATLAGAADPPPRTERVSAAADGRAADGHSSRPAIDARGRFVAFESEATNLAADGNGAVRDVFLRDRRTGRTTLVSAPADGAAADGVSDSPAVTAAGDVVFSSRATNLVAGDGNGARDVFLRRAGGELVRVSVSADGGQANGASFQPDVSRDGRFVVFTSFADNLVAGDTNGVEDVFVRDLLRGTTRRISERDGAPAGGRSRAPAISPEGRYVSFESTAPDLVDGDTNEVADVFLKDLLSGRLRRVSVSSREREQNRAVVPPFVTVSDVSTGGRYVAWDSDATNLVRGDRNRDTDVFVRDVRRGRTERVSRSSTGRGADNDSYMPALSHGGRYVSFSSFARNLWVFDAPGEDLFLRDRRLGVTTPLTVTNRGRERGRERERQLLRRPAIALKGGLVAFSSGARLAHADTDSVEDVLLRRTTAPRGRIVRGPSGRSRRPRYVLAADDPAAVFLCRVDGGRPFFCPRRGRLPRLSRGTHRLSVRAGGPGMLFDGTVAARRFRVR